MALKNVRMLAAAVLLLLVVTGCRVGIADGRIAGTRRLLCDDSCELSRDGKCDDGGGPSRWQSGSSNCTIGTDCSDCGAKVDWRSAQEFSTLSEAVDALIDEYGVLRGGLSVKNASLTSLAALGNLTHVAGEIRIRANGGLRNLAGMDKLATVNGALAIENNFGLTGLTGLWSLKRVTGFVLINGNSGLKSLTGLEGLDSVHGTLLIKSNGGLTSLTGLESLSTVKGSLLVLENDRLMSLSGLRRLSDVFGLLSVSGNGALQNLNGLELLSSVSSLERTCYYCRADRTQKWSGALTISDNAALTSLSSLRHLRSVSGSLAIERNDRLPSLTGLDGLSEVGGLQIVNNSALTSLAGLASLETVHNELAVSNNRRLVSLAALGELRTVTGGLKITGNPELACVTEFRHLWSLGGLEISGNMGSTADSPPTFEYGWWVGYDDYSQPAASEPCVGKISVWNSVDGDVVVKDNPGLSTLSLESYAVYGDLTVVDNPQLTELSMWRLTHVYGATNLSYSHCRRRGSGGYQEVCSPVSWQTTKPLPHCPKTRCGFGWLENKVPEEFGFRLCFVGCAEVLNWIVPIAFFGVGALLFGSLYFVTIYRNRQQDADESYKQAAVRLSTHILGLADVLTDAMFIASIFVFLWTMRSILCYSFALKKVMGVIMISGSVFLLLSRIVGMLSCFFVCRAHYWELKAGCFRDWRVSLPFGLFCFLDPSFIRDLPWNSNLSEQAKKRFIAIEVIATLLEDLPLLVLQVVFLSVTGTQDKGGIVVTVVYLGTTVFSMVTRVFVPFYQHRWLRSFPSVIFKCCTRSLRPFLQDLSQHIRCGSIAPTNEALRPNMQALGQQQSCDWSAVKNRVGGWNAPNRTQRRGYVELNENPTERWHTLAELENEHQSSTYRDLLKLYDEDM